MAYQKLLTKKGRERLASATPENQLKITHIAVGDGNGSYPDLNENMTKLTNERYRSQVSAPMRDTQDKTILEFEGLIPANIGGFFVREVALFDDTNTMIAIAQTSEVEKPQATEAGTSLTLTLGFRMQLENEGQVNLIFKDAGYIDHAGLTGRDKADSHPITAITGLDGALNNKADKLTRINAGVGLEGGGTLESNRTLRVLLDSSLTSTATDRSATPFAIKQLNDKKQDNLTFVGTGPRTMLEGAAGWETMASQKVPQGHDLNNRLPSGAYALYAGLLNKPYWQQSGDAMLTFGWGSTFYIDLVFGTNGDIAVSGTKSGKKSKWFDLYTQQNTRADKNNVLHAGTSTPIDTLNTSDMAQDVINNDTMTVTSGAVYRALGNNQILEYVGDGPEIMKKGAFGLGAYRVLTFDDLNLFSPGLSFNGDPSSSNSPFKRAGATLQMGGYAAAHFQLHFAIDGNVKYRKGNSTSEVWEEENSFHTTNNTTTDKNGVLHAGRGTPLNTLNTSDLTDHVQAGLIAPVTSSGVYGETSKKWDIVSNTGYAPSKSADDYKAGEGGYVRTDWTPNIPKTGLDLITKSQYGSADLLQIAFPQRDIAELHMRTKSTTGWSDWFEFYHTKNFNPNNKADKTTQIIAGNGMSGGGTLAGNRTITLGNVSETSITSTNSVTSGGHSHALSAGVKASLGKADGSLQAASNLSDVPNKVTARNNLGVTAELDKKRSLTDNIFRTGGVIWVYHDAEEQPYTGLNLQHPSGQLSLRRDASGASFVFSGSPSHTLKIPQKTDTIATEGQIFGVGQKWADVTSQRSPATPYTNNTGKVIFLNIVGGLNETDSTAYIVIDGIKFIREQRRGQYERKYWYLPVPPGSVYSVENLGSGTESGLIWLEMR